jgi:hypothetical protein
VLGVRDAEVVLRARDADEGRSWLTLSAGLLLLLRMKLFIVGIVGVVNVVPSPRSQGIKGRNERAVMFTEEYKRDPRRRHSFPLQEPSHGTSLSIQSFFAFNAI